MIAPKLRFPEFKDEWHTKKLGEITVQMQSGLSRKLSSKDVGLPVIRSNNIRKGKIDTSDISYWFVDDPQGANTQNYILKRDDLLVNFINSLSQIGKFALYRDEISRDVIFTTNIMRLKFQKGIVPEFVVGKFSRKEYRDFIDSITKPAVNQASFTTVDFKRFSMAIPSFEEQEKIANFLSIIDRKIASIDKKIELLKQYKKAVMQKIFTQQIRFHSENGEGYLDWEEKRLGELVEFYRGNLLSKSDLTEGGSHKGIHYGELFTEYGEVIENVKSRTNRDSGSHSHIGDLLMPTSDVTPQGLARASVIQENGVMIGGDINILRPTRDDVNPFFLCYLINWQKKKIMRLVTGSTVRHVYSKDIAKIVYLVPGSIGEQQEIAGFLMTISTKIKAEESSLDMVREFKKALLERMLV